MLTRRELIKSSALLVAASPVLSLAKLLQAPRSSFIGDDVFQRLIAKAQQNGWDKLPIGELIGKIGTELLGTPYVGHTLELDANAEICAINLAGLDCVTFFESSLDLARILKQGHPTKQAFIDAVRFTRYRGGVQGDYTTRLHYTSDWMWDNVKKGTVANITPSLPGAAPFTQKVGFMTEKPEDYLQLKANPAFVPKIKVYEDIINARSMSYLPVDKIADAESLLQTGDIIGITTTEDGIDMSHTGLLYRTSDDVIHFMDASSRRVNMKVTLETPRLSESMRMSKRNTGIMVVRPLEP
ncbi:MAG TPA: N-acetylmuramoyl-L-alanine amidase-like domain-containing protein [Fimbriimonadaceae bacterium]|jgi:hypothetical protein